VGPPPRTENLPNTDGDYKCQVCHKWLPVWCFYEDKVKSNGRKSTCKECHKKLDKQRKRLRRYGLTTEDFEIKMESQDGCCACCGVELELDGKRTRSPCIDHNHDTGEIRDIICTRCNLAAGNLKDSSERARKLMEYLKKWNC